MDDVVINQNMKEMEGPCVCVCVCVCARARVRVRKLMNHQLP